MSDITVASLKGNQNPANCKDTLSELAAGTAMFQKPEVKSKSASVHILTERIQP